MLSIEFSSVRDAGRPRVTMTSGRMIMICS